LLAGQAINIKKFVLNAIYHLDVAVKNKFYADLPRLLSALAPLTEN
jgi:hypothetical protein